MRENQRHGDFQWNYLKLSFVNLVPLDSGDRSSAGKMTTNSPELPRPSEQPPPLVLHQIVTSLRLFFSLLHGTVDVAGHEDDLYACDWATMTFSKAP